MKHFRSPSQSLDALDAESASALISAASDVALVVDAGGVIRDLAFNSENWAAEWGSNWLGQPWIDTVTRESRPKIEALLREAGTLTPTRQRHVNHPSSWGTDVPVLYSAVRLGSNGNIIAFGRDMSSTAALQQQLVNAQVSMERDYTRLRHMETRYRLLFQTTTEGVLVVDAATRKIVEANPVAARFLFEDAKRVVGRAFPEGFDAHGTQAVAALLASVRATGRSEAVQAHLEHGNPVNVQASLFRQENAPLFLIRLVPVEDDAFAAAMSATQSTLLKIVENAPDGFVVTDEEAHILFANAAFLDLAELASPEQAQGALLDRWLGNPGVDMDVLRINLRQHGAVKLYATSLRGDYGASTLVEVSAVAVPSEVQPCFGFTIRNVGRRLAAEPRPGRELPRSVEQLTELVGRVPLKDLVRETTDVIERLCIEAALELTGDNRASAAELLGLSRQSLYVKLRRYGLGDLATEG